MSTLGYVGIAVILLIAFLMLSIPLPFCFGGALGFLVLTADVSMKSMKLLIFGYIPVVFLTAFVPFLSECLPRLLGYM